MREAPAAELARQGAGEHDETGTGERRQKADPQYRIAEQSPSQPGLQRRERRHVDVSPRQVLAAGEEVQLVDEQPVDAGGCQVHEQLYDGEVGDDRRPRGESAAAAPPPELASGPRVHFAFRSPGCNHLRPPATR